MGDRGHDRSAARATSAYHLRTYTNANSFCVSAASAHARPAAAGGESAIWMFDAATQALTGASCSHISPSPALWCARKGKADCGLRWRRTAHWVNPDGSHPRTRVAVRAGDGALVLTGDVAAYNQAHPGDVVYEVVSAAIAPRRAGT